MAEAKQQQQTSELYIFINKKQFTLNILRGINMKMCACMNMQ